jgi:hypothetical protein
MFDTLIPLTITLARAYGVVILAVALAALLSPARMKATLEDFERSAGLSFLAALFAVTLGMTLVIVHSVWADFPAALVSLLGWAILIKGILLLAVPEGLLKLGSALASSASMVRAWGVFALVLSIVYLVIGFAARALAGI